VLDKNKIMHDLNYLKNECHVLPLPEALDHMFTGVRLPSRAAAIIIDDATSSFYRTGREILSSINLPYTLAVIPGLIKSNKREHLLARLMRIAGHEYWLPAQEMLERALEWLGESENTGEAAFETVFIRASELDDSKLIGLLDHLRALDHDFMTWEELKQVQSQDKVHFASHTMSHPQLRFVSGKWLDWEFERSRQLLEQNLGIKVNSLVVPYGHPKHFTAEVQLALNKAGFEYMFFTEKGIVGPATQHYRMPRMPLEDESWRLRIHSCPAVSSILYPEM
jgi:peptidoglycan/xylan/chitin deacetylase (PgdA/CDA1 family)